MILLMYPTSARFACFRFPFSFSFFLLLSLYLRLSIRYERFPYPFHPPIFNTQISVSCSAIAQHVAIYVYIYSTCLVCLQSVCCLAESCLSVSVECLRGRPPLHPIHAITPSIDRHSERDSPTDAASNACFLPGGSSLRGRPLFVHSFHDAAVVPAGSVIA
jgi:hypothetical protein